MNGAGDCEMVKMTYPHSTKAMNPSSLFVHVTVESIVSLFIALFYPNSI